MLSPGLVLLAAVASAFALFVWIVVVGREHPAASLAAFADARGWDHHRAAPAAADVMRARVPAAHRDGDRVTAFFSGPSGAGPFQMWALRPGGRGAGPWSGDRTLVHLRTADMGPGLEFAPAGRFRLDTAPDAVSVDHPAFRRRYVVTAEDAAAARGLLDWETCAILCGPPKGVMVSWQGHDLFVLFPVAPRTAAGFETLLSFASGLALRFMGSPGRRAPGRTAPEPRVSPAKRPAAS